MKRRPTPQPRLDKPRQQVSSAFMDSLHDAAQKEARRWNVSVSFIIATAASYALGVSEQPDYRRSAKTEPRRRPHRLLPRLRIA